MFPEEEKRKSADPGGEQDECGVTRKLGLPPVCRAIRHRDNHHPHLILGCPVVMFFNYVSLFNVATAPPYLVNRCNFSRRAEMQPVQPGIKGQTELPQAHVHAYTHARARTEAERFTFISTFSRLHRQFKPQQGDFQRGQQLSRKKMAIYPLKVRYFIFDYTITLENTRHILLKNGPG